MGKTTYRSVLERPTGTIATLQNHLKQRPLLMEEYKRNTDNGSTEEAAQIAKEEGCQHFLLLHRYSIFEVSIFFFPMFDLY